MAFGASLSQYGERRRIHLCLLITDSVVKNAFIRGREREGGRQQPHNAMGKEQRRDGARDAEALIRGAGCWECRQAVGANGVNGPCEVKDRPMLRMRDGSRRVGALEGRKK